MDRDDSQLGLFPDPLLESDYTKHWEHLGFSWDAFLRWRVSPQDLAQAYTSSDYLLGHEESARRCLPENDRFVNPEWASRWADYFPDIRTAFSWCRLTKNPEEAYAMKRLGYRKQSRAFNLYHILKRNHLMPRLMHRTDIKPPIPADPDNLYEDTHYGDWVKYSMALYLSPTFNLSQSQVDTIASKLDELYQRPGLVQSVTDLLLAFHHRGWPIPDGDGVLTFLLEEIGSTGDLTVPTYIISQAEHYDDFINLVKVLKNIEYIGLDDVARASYSIQTGVPVEWVDLEMGQDVRAGRIDGVTWKRRAPLSNVTNSLHFLLLDGYM